MKHSGGSCKLGFAEGRALVGLWAERMEFLELMAPPTHATKRSGVLGHVARPQEAIPRLRLALLMNAGPDRRFTGGLWGTPFLWESLKNL